MEKIHTGKIITLKYGFAKEDTDIVKVQRNKNDSVIRNARQTNKTKQTRNERDHFEGAQTRRARKPVIAKTQAVMVLIRNVVFKELAWLLSDEPKHRYKAL